MGGGGLQRPGKGGLGGHPLHLGRDMGGHEGIARARDAGHQYRGRAGTAQGVTVRLGGHVTAIGDKRPVDPARDEAAGSGGGVLEAALQPTTGTATVTYDPDRISKTDVIAAIEGAAVAGAFELVLPVDFRIIAEDASYGLLEVTLGVFPSGGGTQRLPRLVGLSKAKEIVLTGDLIDPQEAADCNLVHEVVAPDEVAPTAREWADNLAENAPLGMEAARELLNTALDVPLEQGLELESARGARLVETDDYTEGFTARLEGREPEFEGK